MVQNGKTIFFQDDFFRSVFNQHHNPILIIDSETGKIVDCNPSAVTFYGYTKEEMTFLSIQDINVLTNDQIRYEMNLAKQKKRNHFYFQHRLKNGEVHHVEVESHPIQHDDHIFLASFIRDITDTILLSDSDRKYLTNLEAKISEKTYELEQDLDFKNALFDTIPGMLYIYDENRCLYVWNHTLEKMTGYSTTELLGLSVYQLHLVQDKNRVDEAINKVFANGYAELEADLVRKDGSTIRVLFNGVPLNRDEKRYFLGVGIDVSEQRKQAEKLNENMKLLDLFFQQSLSGSFFMMMDEPVAWNDSVDKEKTLDFIFDHQKMTKVNQAMLDQYQQTREAMLGHTPRMSFSHDEVAGKQAWKKMLDAGSAHLLTTELKKDGSKMIIEGDYICIYDNNGNFIGHFGIQNDVTDRINANRRIDHMMHLMNYIIEHNNGGIAVHDRDLNYIFVSQRYLNQYGVKEENIIGKHHYSVFPDLPEKWREVHRKALKGIISSADYDPYLRSDGTIEWTRWECRPWYDLEGQIGGIIVYTEVITKQKLIEDELKRSSELMEATMQSVGDAVISCDVNGFIKFVNKAAHDILHTSDKDTIGVSLEKILRLSRCKTSRDARSLVRKVVNGAAKATICDDAELNITADLSIPISGSASPILSSSGEIVGCVVIFRDITEEKERQDKILYASLHDSLTGLKNHRAFDIEIESMYVESNLPFTIMMADINGLKLINDSFGHAMGDELIVQVANVFFANSRNKDLVVRYGGDEFVLAFPKMDEEQAYLMMKKMISECSKRTIGNISISVSIGFETVTSMGYSVQDIFTEAENHMYRRKLSESTSQKSKTVDLIVKTLYEKNPRELAHSKRVGLICSEMAKALEWEDDEIKTMFIAGTLHDIGKIGIPESILNKIEKLTDEEWKLIQKHPEIGYRILSGVQDFSEISKFVLEHHEKWDGTGYPRKISGDNISIHARIIGLADAFDAMTSYRTYRSRKTKAEALREIELFSGKQFDPNLVPIFIDLIQNKDL